MCWGLSGDSPFFLAVWDVEPCSTLPVKNYIESVSLASACFESHTYVPEAEDVAHTLNRVTVERGSGGQRPIRDWSCWQAQR